MTYTLSYHTEDEVFEETRINVMDLKILWYELENYLCNNFIHIDCETKLVILPASSILKVVITQDGGLVHG
jgi:hypothetical protein